jgi:hypothetical protein
MIKELASSTMPFMIGNLRDCRSTGVSAGIEELT